MENEFRFFITEPTPKMIYPKKDFYIGSYDGLVYGVAKYLNPKHEFTVLNLIPLRYTGVKDKHGSKVYEGDLLKDFVSSIIWEVRIGYCSKYHFTGVYCLGNNRESIINNDQDSDRNSHIEIIGNIYERA